MGIVEELKLEVSEQAGSPEGFLRLIHLLFEEVQKIDARSPEAPQQYVALIRAYVLVKRQLAYFTKRCEDVEIDRCVYGDTLRHLKHAIKVKREEVRKYARESLTPETVKELNQYVGTHLRLPPRELTGCCTVKREQYYMGGGAHVRVVAEVR